MNKMNQEQAIAQASEVFNPKKLEKAGGGFYRYTESIGGELISRKGLIREASKRANEELVIVSRNDVQSYPENRLGIGSRITVLQNAADYEKEQLRKLKNKFNENSKK